MSLFRQLSPLFRPRINGLSCLSFPSPNQNYFLGCFPSRCHCTKGDEQQIQKWYSIQLEKIENDQKRTRNLSASFSSKFPPIPQEIVQPFYIHQSSSVVDEKERKSGIPHHFDSELKLMEQSCKLARQILSFAGSCVRPGVTTEWIDDQVRAAILDAGAYPSPLLYQGFPKSCCISVNECVIHGVPNSRQLQDGDLVHIDITVFKNGFHGDCSETFICGSPIDESSVRLKEIAREMVYEAINFCKPGVPITAVGNICQNIAFERGVWIVPEIVGHGIGHHFHPYPRVPHISMECGLDPEELFPEVLSVYGKDELFPPNEESDLTHEEEEKSERDREESTEEVDEEDMINVVMEPGMTFTIEPAILDYYSPLTLLPDRWSIVTKNGAWSASHEHTVLITDDGCRILTEEK